jgi:cell division protein FtsQ
MFKSGFKSTRLVKSTAWIAVLIGCAGMAEHTIANQRCNTIKINLDVDANQSFLNKADIEALLTQNGSHPVLGEKLSDLNLELLERRVKKNKLIKECEIFRDFNSGLVIDVTQEVPIARYIPSNEAGINNSREGFYINEEGNYFPLSKRYAERTLLVSGDYFIANAHSSILKTKDGEKILSFIHHLNSDPFWQAQITQVNVNKAGIIELLTSLGNQRIEFGTAEHIESRLKKLQLFYQGVLTADWNKYSKISVRYKDQIVCE